MNSNNSNNPNNNKSRQQRNNNNQQQPRQHRSNNNSNNNNNNNNDSDTTTTTTTTTTQNIILVLHGNQQTGQLLLGRIERLTKRLKKEFDNNNNIETIAPDAPHLLPVDNSNNNNNSNSNGLLRTWWNRDENNNNNYVGLEVSLEVIHQTILELKKDKKNIIIGILGFSQGARFAHLLALVHQKQKQKQKQQKQKQQKQKQKQKQKQQQQEEEMNDHCCWFPHLQFVMLVAGYDATPLVPPELVSYFQNNNNNKNNHSNEDDTFSSDASVPISLSSLHIWGSNDTLVIPDQSEALSNHYCDVNVDKDEEGSIKAPIKQIYVHPGRHHVPTKGSEIHIYIDFIRKVLSSSSSVSPQTLSSSMNESVVLAQTTTTATTTTTTRLKQQVVEDASSSPQKEPIISVIPEEEIASMQQEEVQALEIIYPDNNAIQLISGRDNDDGEQISFDFPIIYRIKLNDIFMEDEEIIDNTNVTTTTTTTTNWPKQPLTIEIRYPVYYPSDDDDGEQHQNDEQHCLPIFKLLHNNTVFEFPSIISEKLLNIIRNTAIQERGMPCVLSCLYAAREFLDLDRDNGLWDTNNNVHHIATTIAATNAAATTTDANITNGKHDEESDPLIQKSSPDEIQKGILEGLEIAQSILSSLKQKQKEDSNIVVVESGGGGGGLFGTSYTIGLVGKPSAGKSTFFNAATGFSRQRGQQQQQQQQQQTVTAANTAGSSDESSTIDESKLLGGASMAAHPFTTIDPNIGYCLIPAPFGSCPEDHYCNDDQSSLSLFGSTHGRDPNGRRFIPVQLKDVAGLVPGAYQGKGRGNQFLNDLTDATVLIHVVDSSGSADSSGNKIIVEEEEEKADGGVNDTACTEQLYQRTNPIDDLKWIRSELVEWVYSNLIAKWHIIIRKGRSKLIGMFSGYGQREVMIDTIFNALDKYLDVKHQSADHHHHQHNQQHDHDRDHSSTPISLDRIDLWSECDIHRLVSLFLGVRFPMALALNKTDLPSAKQFVKSIQVHLPIHGASVGTPVSAKKEMNFVKEHMLRSLNNTTATNTTATAPATGGSESSPVGGVWDCLTSAIELRLPILVFPVGDIITWEPMPGMNKIASIPGKNPSLPSKGMIDCIVAAGGISPTCWNTDESNYNNNNNNKKSTHSKLRDVLLMKPGSTVEDVFLTLKRLGVISGEFVRAEACSGNSGGTSSNVNENKPKPIPKNEIICQKNRIIKIMTNKRTQWQS